MLFVDTAFFIAIVHPGDEYHGRAKLWVNRVKGTFLTTDYVLLEVANFFHARPNRRTALELLRTVRSDPFQVVAASQDWFDRGLLEYERAADKDWSLTDCISFCVMRERWITR